MESVLDVFSGIGSWIVEFIPTLFSLFYQAESGLTLIGIMSLMALAIGLVLLFINILRSIIKFR